MMSSSSSTSGMSSSGKREEAHYKREWEMARDFFINYLSPALRYQRENYRPFFGHTPTKIKGLAINTQEFAQIFLNEQEAYLSREIARRKATGDANPYLSQAEIERFQIFVNWFRMEYAKAMMDAYDAGGLSDSEEDEYEVHPHATLPEFMIPRPATPESVHIAEMMDAGGLNPEVDERFEHNRMSRLNPMSDANWGKEYPKPEPYPMPEWFIDKMENLERINDPELSALVPGNPTYVDRKMKKRGLRKKALKGEKIEKPEMKGMLEEMWRKADSAHRYDRQRLETERDAEAYAELESLLSEHLKLEGDKRKNNAHSKPFKSRHPTVTAEGEEEEPAKLSWAEYKKELEEDMALLYPHLKVEGGMINPLERDRFRLADDTRMHAEVGAPMPWEDSEMPRNMPMENYVKLQHKMFKRLNKNALEQHYTAYLEDPEVDKNYIVERAKKVEGANHRGFKPKSTLAVGRVIKKDVEKEAVSDSKELEEEVQDTPVVMVLKNYKGYKEYLLDRPDMSWGEVFTHLITDPDTRFLKEARGGWKETRPEQRKKVIDWLRIRGFEQEAEQFRERAAVAEKGERVHFYPHSAYVEDSLMSDVFDLKKFKEDRKYLKESTVHFRTNPSLKESKKKKKVADYDPVYGNANFPLFGTSSKFLVAPFGEMKPSHEKMQRGKKEFKNYAKQKTKGTRTEDKFPHAPISRSVLAEELYPPRSEAVVPYDVSSVVPTPAEVKNYRKAKAQQVHDIRRDVAERFLLHSKNRRVNYRASKKRAREEEKEEEKEEAPPPPGKKKKKHVHFEEKNEKEEME